MEYIISFLISVMAGLVSYYICKWLDRNDSDISLNGLLHRITKKKPQ